MTTGRINQIVWSGWGDWRTNAPRGSLGGCGWGVEAPPAGRGLLPSHHVARDGCSRRIGQHTPRTHSASRTANRPWTSRVSAEGIPRTGSRADRRGWGRVGATRRSDNGVIRRPRFSAARRAAKRRGAAVTGSSFGKECCSISSNV